MLAIAHDAEVDLTIGDFQRIGRKVPHLADVKPFGRFVMKDIDHIGGIPVVMRTLLEAGLLDGDCLTVTGSTVAENLAELNPPHIDGKVIRSMAEPIHRTGGLTILTGSLAPDGAVVKSAGFDSDVFEGAARVFDGERAAMDAVEDGTLQPGDVVVIRYEGPKVVRDARYWPSPARSRAPGSARRAAAHRRFSGSTTGLCGHIAPRRWTWPVAFVHDGDRSG